MATLQGDDDMRLPPCCRRHGAHHCAMSDAMMARMAQAEPGSAPAFTAPSHCPLYPGSLKAAVTPVHALAPPTADMPFLLAQAHSPAASRAAARMSQIRTRAGRGPPSMHFS
ncbi:MAG: hypothetical protein KGM96_10620 [Acidobacteriota bacterium]|nr:hypothetical protein [Acidobacteriota bacterium]